MGQSEVPASTTTVFFFESSKFVLERIFLIMDWSGIKKSLMVHVYTPLQESVLENERNVLKILQPPFF